MSSLFLSLQPAAHLLINGQKVQSSADSHIDVLNPATQQVVGRVPHTTGKEFEAAVQAAKEAFPAWRSTPLPTRARVMLKLQELIRSNMVRVVRLSLLDAPPIALQTRLLG